MMFSDFKFLFEPIFEQAIFQSFFISIPIPSRFFFLYVKKKYHKLKSSWCINGYGVKFQLILITSLVKILLKNILLPQTNTNYFQKYLNARVQMYMLEKTIYEDIQTMWCYFLCMSLECGWSFGMGKNIIHVETPRFVIKIKIPESQSNFYKNNFVLGLIYRRILNNHKCIFKADHV